MNLKEDIDPLLSVRSTINPYRFAADLIINRLLWDVRLESWRSRKKLLKYKDRYASGKAVIVCNGPSLLKTDLGLLNGVFTIGLNKINLIFNRSEYRPSCIVAVNNLVINQNQQFYNTTEIPLFIDFCGTRYIKKRNNVIFLHSCRQPKFARDCSISIQQGYTVTYAAMQLAFHMGFRDIALVGCDHNFATKGQANKTVGAAGEDNNHFDPKYFSDNQKWQLPDLAGSEYYYSLARDYYLSSGGSIFNCTEGGLLEIFERKKLALWLKE